MIQVERDIQVKCAVICPISTADKKSLSPQSRITEAEGLAKAINLQVCYKEALNLKTIKPSLYFSRGFIERISPIIAENEIELLVIDTSLSPIQQRNLEKELNVKVIDRTALILEIFGERAQTREGVLQVELAHLTYQRSRLVRSWTHLERQRGGAGFLGGPGETQIEMDRRIIDDKIVRLKKELEKVRKTRNIQRSARRKVPYPIVTLVGYTNAGKSTLFNYLTSSGVMAADMLFATLDPTMRKLTLPSGKEIILSDTVGFISDLPHELVMAFRATLEEVLNADIIVHIRDIFNEDTLSQRSDVLKVLESLGLKDIEYAQNYIEVWNKADLLNPEEHNVWENQALKNENCILLSALSGEGCEKLLQIIEQKLTNSYLKYSIMIPNEDGKTAAWLHKNALVENIVTQEGCDIYKVQISADNLSRLAKTAGKNNRISIRRET
ncbi:MAG: GTPase HflX [Alphaproteobacteria bacterium]|nr:GTPase HflX [Alphaproteobacteria bacterium]